MHISIKRIVKEVAEELNIDSGIVSMVVSSQFKFIALKVKENLSTNEDPTIALRYFGKFKVKKKRRNAIKLKSAKAVDAIMDFIQSKDDNK